MSPPVAAELVPMPGLVGKHAIVTAATAGIGLSIAQGFVASGTHVVLLSRDPAKLARIRDQLLQDYAKHGAKVYIVQVDLGKPADTRRAMRQALEMLGGKLDFLVNNGPGYNWQTTQAGDDDACQVDVFTINNVATMASIAECLEALKQSRCASIINMASVCGIAACPGTYATGYNAAKAGLISTTRDLALEYAKFGIRVNVLSPGITHTDITAHAAKLFQMQEEEYISWREANIPLGFTGLPEDVANMALFLCSPASRWITGNNIVIDGGMTLTSTLAVPQGVCMQF